MSNINWKDHLIAHETLDKVADTLQQNFEEMPIYKKLIQALNQSEGKE